MQRAEGSRVVGPVVTGKPVACSPQVSLRGALAQANPQATDAALEASLTPTANSWLKAAMFNESQTWRIPEHRHTLKPLPTCSETELFNALTMVKYSLTPMTGAECQKALLELKVLTASRTEQTDDIKLTVELYRRRLEKYPADVVRHVLQTQPSRSRWWPAWAELEERLEPLSRQRFKMAELLTASISQHS